MDQLTIHTIYIGKNDLFHGSAVAIHGVHIDCNDSLAQYECPPNDMTVSQS